MKGKENLGALHLQKPILPTNTSLILSASSPSFHRTYSLPGGRLKLPALLLCIGSGPRGTFLLLAT